MDLDNANGAGELASSTLTVPSQNQDASEAIGIVLPFEEMDDFNFGEVNSGPRISSAHSHPQNHYGPVSIRNYLAGHAKKMLRISRVKGAPEWGDLFLRLPIEIKLLVLEHLHPIDLYHFSLTSKRCRSLVLDPKACGVWEYAFKCHSDLPNPPPKTSYSAWASMLYGPGVCGECGRLGGLTDFAFRKRFCEICMRHHYSYLNSLTDSKGEAVQVNHPVCLLVPRSFRYHGLRYTTSYTSATNAQYLRSDFADMMKKVTLIQLVIAREHSQEVLRLAELFNDYRDALMDHVDEINLCADAANNWAMDIYRSCSSEYDAAARELTKRCMKRLENLGHETRDIDSVQFSITHTIRHDHVYRLTPSAFRKIHPKLEAIVMRRKVERLKMERKDLIEGIYIDFQKTLDPARWQYLPPVCLVKDIEGFQEFLNAPFDARGDISIEYAVSLLPPFIAAWTTEKQAQILGLFPSTVPLEDHDTKLTRLDLARNVITCSDCHLRMQSGRALIGWDAICRHMPRTIAGHHRPCGRYEVNEQASAAAVSLISCVGLNPATATAEEMHKRDHRFMCGNCLPETSRGITGLKVYTWVECIIHTMEMHIVLRNAMHDVPAWILLTPEATNFVKEHEYEYPRPASSPWRCDKCATHYSDPTTQLKAIEHVKKVHLIKDPVVGVDVVPEGRFTIRRRKPFRLGRDPAYEFKCMKCPKMGINKLWELQALAEHLLLKHKIQDPTPGVDWAKVDIIAPQPLPVPEAGSILPEPSG